MKTDLADGLTLKEMFASGTARLEKCAPDINAINVFPVPNGDTGTNMVLTMQFALEQAKSNSDNQASSVAKSLAHGALMGARGNSGVILSQCFRGLAKGLEGKTNFDGGDFARALAGASQSAYKGIAAGPVAADSLPGGAGFYGLLHASGNVSEWCHDRFDPRWYLRGSRRNPRGPLQHTHRVVRGGSFLSSPDAARLQLRDHLDANGAERDVGFRVARAWSDVDPPESD